MTAVSSKHAPAYAHSSPASEATAEALAWTIVRAATGLMLMPHGAQKLFGLFGAADCKARDSFSKRTSGYTPAYCLRAWPARPNFSAACFSRSVC